MLQRPNPLANRRRQAAANKIFVSLPTILAQAKFVQAMPMTGMAGDILPMEALGHPALRFERILDDSTIQDLAQLNCVSYDVPVETSLSLVKEHTLWYQHAYGFVAHEGNKSVTNKIVLVTGGHLRYRKSYGAGLCRSGRESRPHWPP
jgi:hypothetical protein